jgi:hypothetical protein
MSTIMSTSMRRPVTGARNAIIIMNTIMSAMTHIAIATIMAMSMG